MEETCYVGGDDMNTVPRTNKPSLDDWTRDSVFQANQSMKKIMLFFIYYLERKYSQYLGNKPQKCSYFSGPTTKAITPTKLSKRLP